MGSPSNKGGTSPATKMGGADQGRRHIWGLWGRLGRHFFEVVLFDVFFDRFSSLFGSKNEAQIDLKSTENRCQDALRPWQRFLTDI